MRLLFLIPFLSLISCSIKTGSNQKVDSYKYFDCQNNIMPITKTEEVLVLKAKELRTCFLENSEKIVWISSYWQGCSSQDIVKQKIFFEKYKDKLVFVIVSETFDIKEVKEIEEKINYPVFFIDPSYSNARLKNSAEYMKDVLKENITDEALKHTSVFVKNGKVLKVAYNADLTEDFFMSLF